MKISFIGAGKMTHAFCEGLSHTNFFTEHQVTISNTSQGKLDELKSLYPITVTQNNVECIKQADLIILAIKPQQLYSVTQEIKSSIKENTIIVSLAAGVTLSQCEKWLNHSKIVRLMPNTAIAKNSGAIACTTLNCSQEEFDSIVDLIQPLGNIYIIDESKMNAYIAANGSGIAFVYELMRVFTKQAIEFGLDESIAQSVVQNAFNAASQMVDDNTDIQMLIDQVTSKAGTTIEGINVLRQSELESIVHKTYEATIHRAEEISQSYEGLE
ncbi:MAG: pyrroline-5-carboxylate reductase [Erysipelotrichaceae bacterium]